MRPPAVNGGLRAVRPVNASMKILRNACLLALFACLAAFRVDAQATPKIGVFDPNKLLANSKLGQALQDDMNKWRVAKEAELKKSGEDLERRFQQYKASVASMSSERKEEVEADLEKSRLEFERTSRDADTELQRRRQKAFKQIETEMSSVLPEYAQSKGYTVILERAVCAWASPTVDVTDELVRLLDSRKTTP